MQPKLQQLVTKGLVWQGKPSSLQEHDYLPSGSQPLDEKLGGGWQLGGLHECQQQRPFTEQRLIVPLLNQALQRQLPVFWVAPPALLSAAGLTWQLCQSSYHVVIEASGLEAAWAFEQILLSGSGLALLWLPQQDTDAAMVRRWYKAAQSGLQAGFVFTGVQSQTEARAYTNRVLIQQQHNRLDIIKRRYGWPLHNVAL
ncbi:SulA-like SOS-response cell division inhibitor [Idiomarina seosinensis]|uniref:SulA-like SOS-response cell division inhibitor n=1 Tax=Idiomarina seosinensis TaxID=281739 RepID=A0A432ZEE3_9GAMM|nr:SulA-like SOS-response cell division inhibitor [Idiomarina seosinensis]RUO76269.1 SulA-like SOS-response cell division inhibitor [Idiomarina seosinensis]